MLQPFCFKHEVAIAAIMKNEGNYVKEWLDYHLAAGVTKFYIYDNESTDNLPEILRPYIESGFVNYHRLGGQLAQNPAYMDAVSRYRFECRYMAIIDGDEFILPVGDDAKSIPETVAELFARHKPMPALTMNWRIFGSSGQAKADLQHGVLERFVNRGQDDFNDAKDADGGNFHIKSIVNPRCADFFPNPHYGIYYSDLPAKDEQGNLVFGAFNKHNPAQYIRLNHYITKSREEYEIRRSFGCADNFNIIPASTFDKFDANDVHDTDILRYLSKRRNILLPSAKERERILAAAAHEAFSSAKSAAAPDDMEHGGNIENILCHWYGCQRQYGKYLDAKEVFEFKQILLQKLKNMFGFPQETWQVQLFINVLPMLLNDEPPIRAEMLAFIKKSLPTIMNFYRRQVSTIYYRQAQYLYEIVNII